ncbi:DUF4043 family protein [Ruficoccus amylovorans]|uniref:DUF4043 family protein n=1 Tax=Ruficoccus amylovorans TaxID=1804625 RepID=A0A842HEK6_9BACT|nr:DUF4043 family protein [Ruficoccus amylovorans]MBC2594953.1 DUF4043 family protein [Ruficoccus amylovorans]
MSIELDKVTLLSELKAKDPNFAKKIWSRKIKHDARNKNPFKPLMGQDGSGMPICEKTDLNKMGGETVTFTTTAELGGQGRKGEEELKTHTNIFDFGTYGVTVGERAWAVSYNKLLQFLRLRGDDMSVEQLANSVCANWWGQMETDDIQQMFLRIARLVAPRNMKRVNNRTSQDDLTLADTLNTGGIEYMQQALITNGATPIYVEKEKYGGEVPQYILFSTWQNAASLEDEQKFRDVMREAAARGDKNPYFTGRLPQWKNTVVLRDNVVISSSTGRLARPIQPIAHLGQALADESATTITGGGLRNSDASRTDPALFDYFANFPGFGWTFYEGESTPADANTYYAIIYNLTDGKYEGISYTAANNNGNRLASVTREVATILPTDNARYSNAHPSDSLIIPCTKNGVPLGWSIAMGAEALLLAKGAYDAEPIQHSDDYDRVKGRGIHGIRGYGSPKDTIGRFPNFQVLEHAVEIPGVSLVDMSA